MIVYSTQYESKEKLESDIAEYKAAKKEHSKTIGVPAPRPPNSLVFNIVTNKIAWEWVYDGPIIYNELPEGETVSVIQSAPPDYISLRKLDYPSIGDQLDDLFRSGFFSDEMRAKIQAVKVKYPKQ